MQRPRLRLRFQIRPVAGAVPADEKGTAHEFDSKEAAEAGRKGGQASHEGGHQRGGQR